MSFNEADSGVDSLGSLRALSHPLRLRIIQLLEGEGPLTATQVAERLGDTPSNCSFHLRVLARAGFIVEAPRAPETLGRARPWALVPRTVDVQIDELGDDGRAQLRAAVSAAADQFREHALAWLDRRSELSEEWREASTSRQLLLRLTAAELREINDRITDLLEPYVERLGEEPVPGGRAVAVTIATLPVLPPDGSEPSVGPAS